MRRGALALGALLLAACSASVAEAPIEQWMALDVSVAPVAFGAETVGRLRYRGGLHLVLNDPSGEQEFGGLSGLEVLEDGRFVAVSDFGAWVEGRLLLDEAGALVGVTDIRQAHMRDEDGAVFPDKESADAEDLAQLPDGRFAVSFEQTQTIRIYDLNRDGPFGAARAGPSLAGVAHLPRNSGLEALAALTSSELVIGAEGGAGSDTPIWIAPLDGREPTRPTGRYLLPRAYSLTGFDRLPDGDFVALERFYAPIVGPRARITRIAAAALQGDQIEPEELARLEPPSPVDNFEAISAVRGQEGGVRLYILSDDNLNERQRTLLLAFDLMGEDAEAP